MREIAPRLAVMELVIRRDRFEREHSGDPHAADAV